MGIKVAVVTKLARKDFPQLSIFKRAGISIFARETPQTTGIRNVYSLEDPDKRQSYPLGFAGLFSQKDFPNIEAKIMKLAQVCCKI